jgi:hypothetical protein
LEDACDYVAGETLLRRLERTGWLKPTVQVSIHMTFREKRERVKGIEPSWTSPTLIKSNYLCGQTLMECCGHGWTISLLSHYGECS